MPSYKTKQVDENGKSIYQDICYPVTKEFREKLYGDIEKAYEEAKVKENEEKKSEESEKEVNKSESKDGFMNIPQGANTPFR